MSSDFQLMFELMQEPYFLYGVLPLWLAIPVFSWVISRIVR